MSAGLTLVQLVLMLYRIHTYPNKNPKNESCLFIVTTTSSDQSCCYSSLAFATPLFSILTAVLILILRVALSEHLLPHYACKYWKWSKEQILHLHITSCLWVTIIGLSCHLKQICLSASMYFYPVTISIITPITRGVKKKNNSNDKITHWCVWLHCSLTAERF